MVLRNWLQAFTKNSKGQRTERSRKNKPQQKRRQCRPRAEGLEDRLAPAATLTLNPLPTIVEGGTAALTGTVAGLQPNAAFALDIDWGDPTSPGDIQRVVQTADANGTRIFSINHQYLDDNPSGTSQDQYQVKVILTNDTASPTLQFTDFSSTAGLNGGGSAHSQVTGDGTVLRLSNATYSSTGSVFSTQRFDNAATAFSTSFAFRITNSGGTPLDGSGQAGGDGFVFVVQSYSPGWNPGNSIGEWIGYGGFPGVFAGLSPSVAVEFDTFHNGPSYSYVGDISSNHIGIDINGSVVSVAAADRPGSTARFDNGQLHYVWIDYDGTTLAVRINDIENVRPETPALSYNINIPAYVGPNAYVGFTSATFTAWADHDIVSWTFNDRFIQQVTQATTATITNLPPGNFDILNGTTISQKSLALSLQRHFTDSSLDTFTGTVNYGDGSGDQSLSGSISMGPTGTGTYNLIHTYPAYGTYNVTVRIVDDDGGVGSVSFVVALDATPPAAPVVTTPVAATTVNANSYTITGTAEANSLIKIWRDVNNNGIIDGTETVVASQQLTGGQTNFSISVFLTQNAANNFLATATDAAGNQSSAKDVPAITEDSTAPSTPTDSNAAANSVAEGAANGTLVGITASSTDLGGSAVTYSLTNNAGGRFAINSSTGVVTVASGSLLNYETASSHTITVQASDVVGNTSTASFTIAVTNVNPSSPTDNNAAVNSVAEGAANGTAVGITAFSTDLNGPAVTYSLTNNAGGRFAINSSTGVVTVANGGLLNFETASSHTITVQASAGVGGTSTASFTISVNNVTPSTPTDSNGTANSVAEGAPNGTVVGITASSTDPAGGTITYSLTNNAGGRFAIDSSSGVVTVANGSLLNYEIASSHTITVQASDSASGTSTASFTIAVVNSTTDVSLSGGNLVITDVEGGDTKDSLTISLNGANVRIYDPNNTVGAGAGATQVNANTVDVSLAAITGNIQVDTLGGNDTLTVDLAGGDFLPGGGLTFTAGSGDDGLVISGGSQGTVTYNYTNANDGSVVMSNFGTIHYTGIEPLTNSGTAIDVIFNLPTSGNVQAILEDDGISGNTMSRLRSSPVAFEQVDFTNPSGSLTINRGSSTDDLTVHALPDCTASLTIGTSIDPFDTLTFAGAVTLAANKNLTGFASGTVNLPNTTSDLATSGTGAIALTTAQNIFLASGSSITTVNGNLTLSANQQASPTAGNFVGIDVNGGLVQTTGTGVVNVIGKGGNSGNSQIGVRVRSGGDIIGGSSGTMIVTGTGGASTGNTGVGVFVTDAGSTITSGGANVQVTGTGGASGTAGGDIGVNMASGGLISAGGAGTVQVIGSGFAAGAGSGSGVVVGAGSTITSSGGNVNVNGTSTGTGGTGNTGVVVAGTLTSGGSGTVTVVGQGANSHSGTGVVVYDTGLITAGGTGDVIVTGTGGGGSVSQGVWVVVNNAKISSGPGGGNVTITGIRNGNNQGIMLGDYWSGIGTITNTTGGTITLIADTMELQLGSINAGSSQVTLRQYTNGFPIYLGVTGHFYGGVALGDGELDLVSGGLIQIGDANSGRISISGAVNRAAATNFSLTTGNNIGLDPWPGVGGDYGSFDANGGNVTLNTPNGSIVTQGGVNPAVDILAGTTTINGTVRPGASPGQFLVSGNLVFSSGDTYAVEVNGTTPGTGHDQIVVTSGGVTLGDARLSASGTISPASAGTIVIIDNDGTDAVSGIFKDTLGNLLNEGATVTINSIPFKISYVGGTGNDVVLVGNQPPTVNSNNAAVNAPEGTPATNTGTFSDPNAGDHVTITASVGTVFGYYPNGNVASRSLAGPPAVKINAAHGGTWANGTSGSGVFPILLPSTDGSSLKFRIAVVYIPPETQAAVLVEDWDMLSDNPADQNYVVTALQQSAYIRWDPATPAVVPPIFDGPAGLTPEQILSLAGPATWLTGGTDVGTGVWSWSIPTNDGLAGPTIVTITATDLFGETASTSFSYTVNNVVPVVTSPGNQSANEGASQSFNLGSFSDPGADSPWQVTVNWGDLTPNTVFTMTAPGSIPAQSHTYADNGIYTVTITVAEENGSGASGSASFQANVGNLAPTLSNPAATSPINEGQSTTLSGTISDPGADTFTLDLNWGDPSSPGNTQSIALGNSPINSGGVTWNPSTRQFTVQHQYLDDNPIGTSSDTYTISALVTDDDGGSPSTTASASVLASASPWLAGMPNGTSHFLIGSAPANSPMLVPMAITPGAAFTFSATGLVLGVPPEGNGSFTDGTAAPIFGIADVVAPFLSLVGVFLDNNQPDQSPPRPGSTFLLAATSPAALTTLRYRLY